MSISVSFVKDDGTETRVEATSGLSLMETARDNGVDGIVAECGGNLQCATCHVIVDPVWFDKLTPIQRDEEEMLEGTAAPRTATSRLSCQIGIEDRLDGLRVTLPPYQT